MPAPTLKVLAAAAAMAVSTQAFAQSADLSMLSDFGRPDIPAGVLGAVPAGGNVAGIRQDGSDNSASIEQSDGLANNAEAWQQGLSNRATLVQSGSLNELRLDQAGDHHLATLTQIGIGNQIAVYQTGSGAEVTGLQQGSYNQFVLQQAGPSVFQFSQIGNANQLLVDLPAGANMRVDQLGDNQFMRVTPAP